MALKPLPDRVEALAPLMEETKQFLEAWGPIIAKYRRIAQERTAMLKYRGRDDLESRLLAFKHHEVCEQLEREVRVDVAPLSTGLCLLPEYVDFDGYLSQLKAFWEKEGDYQALLGDDRLPQEVVYRWVERLCDILENLINSVRMFRRHVVAKHIELTSNQTPPSHEPQVVVSIEDGTIRIGDLVHHVPSEQAAAVKILAEANGHWVTRKKMKEISELLRPRPDRIIKKLPKSLLKYIESGHSGYRLKLE